MSTTEQPAERSALRTVFSAPRTAARAVANEVHVSYLFMSNDLWTTLVPATAFVLAAARESGTTGGAWAVIALKGVLYFWLYIYGFNLANQLWGIAEDRLNKPFRPLVTGRSSVFGARVRLGVVLVAFPLAGWFFGVLEYALLWEITYLLSIVGKLERHWAFKDLSMGIGVVAQLAAAWQIVAPITPTAWRWILTVATAILVLIPLQDLRDVTGDEAVGRKTFPMAFGGTATRIFLAAGFAALPIAVHVLLLNPSSSPVAPIADAVLLVLNWWTAVRVLRLRTPEQDHLTYRRFEYWYSIILATAIVAI